MTSIQGHWQLERLSDQEGPTKVDANALAPEENSDNREDNLETFISRLQAGAILSLNKDSGTLSQSIQEGCVATRDLVVTSSANTITLSYAETLETFEGDCPEEIKNTSFGSVGLIGTASVEQASPEGGLHFRIGRLSLFFAASPPPVKLEQYAEPLTSPVTAVESTSPAYESRDDEAETLLSDSLRPQSFAPDADPVEASPIETATLATPTTPVPASTQEPSQSHLTEKLETPIESAAAAIESETHARPEPTGPSLSQPLLEPISTAQAPVVDFPCCSPWTRLNH